MTVKPLTRRRLREIRIRIWLFGPNYMTYAGRVAFLAVAVVALLTGAHALGENHRIQTTADARFAAQQRHTDALVAERNEALCEMAGAIGQVADTFNGLPVDSQRQALHDAGVTAAQLRFRYDCPPYPPPTLRPAPR